jgi:hypothetical protein
MVQVSISDLTPIYLPRLIYHLISDANQLSSKDGKMYDMIYPADIDMDYIFWAVHISFVRSTSDHEIWHFLSI